MTTNLRALLDRIRFYILLLGGFLSIEIPLFIFAFFKYFPRHRLLVWPLALLIGIGAALVVFYLIHTMIQENYELKLLFDPTDYDRLFRTGRKEGNHETV